MPVDRTGAVPGVLALHVERVRGRGRRAGAPVVALAGGPGETNTERTLDFARLLHGAAPSRDVIVFDQRGTGRSGPISCFAVERGEPPSLAVPACADALGPRRSVYTTRESAEDLDAVRRAIGARRIALFGVSYGTWVEQAYLRRHGDRVERLVLDSVVGARDQADPFAVRQLRDVPRVARRLCPDGSRCAREVTRDVYRDFRAVFRQLRRRPVRGAWYDARGRRHVDMLSALLLASVLQEVDIRSNLRAELPRAMAGARHGDLAPLARLTLGAPEARPEPGSGQSATLNLATTCEELDLPWPRSERSPAARRASARMALARVPAPVLAPFGRGLVFALSRVETCSYWPNRPTAPAVTRRFADAPALIFHGEFDLRTPLRSAREFARALPRSRLVTVPHVGHSAAGRDRSPCAGRALRAFFSGRRVAGCPPAPDPYPPRGLAPSTLAAVPALTGVRGRAGRAARAVVLTVADALHQADTGALARRTPYAARVRGGGLRGGSFRAERDGLRLRRYAFAGGLRVSGLVTRRGTVRLKVAGAATGFLAFSEGGRVLGRLAGRAVRARIGLPRLTATERDLRRADARAAARLAAAAAGP